MYEFGIFSGVVSSVSSNLSTMVVPIPSLQISIDSSGAVDKRKSRHVLNTPNSYKRLSIKINDQESNSVLLDLKNLPLGEEVQSRFSADSCVLRPNLEP